MKQAHTYFQRVLLTSAVVAPLLQIVSTWLFVYSALLLLKQFNSSHLPSAGIVLGFTLTAAFLFGLVFFLRGNKVIPRLLKQQMTLFLVIGTVFPFLQSTFIRDNYNPFIIALIVLPYSVPVIAGVWLYQLKPVEKTITTISYPN